MEEILLKQQKVEEFKVDNANAYQAQNEIQEQVDSRHA
jgi:hypothetical protein